MAWRDLNLGRGVGRLVGARLPPGPATGVALLLVGVAAVVRLALNPALGEFYPFVTFFLAVIGAAALAGWVGWAAALASSTLLAWYLFVPPQMSFAVATRDFAVALPLFVVNAALSGAVAAALRGAILRLRRAEGAQSLLIDELNHRVKNTLATVQSLAAQTARSTRSIEEFEAVFEPRLQALSRAHDLLTQEHWRGAELGELIRQTLAPHDPDGSRVLVEGPPIRLSPNAAVTVNLAVHELATNAVKYGALSAQGGRVEVRWVAREQALEFLWRETGLQGVQPPMRQGFGSRLLKAAARELNAHVEPRHTPEGYAYHWRAPFSAKLRPQGGPANKIGAAAV